MESRRDVVLARASTSAQIRADARPRGNSAVLGLAIARWVAVAHGGTVELARSTPAGSEFLVVLPAPSMQVLSATAREGSIEGDAERRHVPQGV